MGGGRGKVEGVGEEGESKSRNGIPFTVKQGGWRVGGAQCVSVCVCGGVRSSSRRWGEFWTHFQTRLSGEQMTMS